MYVRHIEIQGIGGIERIRLDFNNSMNIICGPNGIGKTTVLECVGHSFSASNSYILKRNSRATEGTVDIAIDSNSVFENRKYSLTEFSPEKHANINGMHELSNKLLYLKTHRSFDYTQVDSIQRDPARPIHVMFESAKTGVNISEFKNWFINRHLYSKHDNSLSPEQVHNYNLAIRCFSILEEGYSFSRIVAGSNEIMINSPNGEIFYEYLSSGFKSTLSILFGIIKEVEFRFQDPFVRADEFDGVVLIDELELHLHPAWQGKVPSLLRETFPACQFIATTHSPHVIQAANPEEVIALENNDGTTRQRPLPSSLYGYRGWTIEEVLTDVMGMPDTRTEQFATKMDMFNSSVDKNDHQEAEKAFEELSQMIHPGNELRKLLKLQLASIKVDDQ